MNRSSQPSFGISHQKYLLKFVRNNISVEIFTVWDVMQHRLDYQHFGRVETESGGTRKHTGGEVKGEKAIGGGSQQSCTVLDTVYPALLPLMRTPRLPAAD